jgi:hypothetical protein
MKFSFLTALFLIAQTPGAATATDHVENLKSNILASPVAYELLRELTKDIGPRLSGSVAEERAVAWSEQKLKSFNLTNVFLAPVQVPHWERGAHESAFFESNGQRTELAVAALGRSAGASGLSARVIEVQSLDELRRLGEGARGNIIFFNRPMDPTLPDTFDAYAGAVDQRSRGPALAASLGAVAALVRSMTLQPDSDYPHAGATSFRGITPIPAAALSTHAANVLSAALKTQPDLRVTLDLSARNYPDKTSYNVIGEIRGHEKPDEIVLVGGHMDSWDLGEGAHDDGAGIVQSMDVCRAIAELSLKPKRTIRCVMFAAEELGGIGGGAYAEMARQRGERHIMAIESDRGGFAPKSISIDGTDADVALANSWSGDFQDLGMTDFYQGGAGTDVEPLRGLGAITMELIPDSTHYFDYHHAATDRFEAVDRMDLAKGSAALAAIVWRYSELP